jgi:mannose-6-phosphate isomerase
VVWFVLKGMACSDNVIRAGLTPKFRDTETLCSSLQYDYG